jgi:CRISPR system Cascade subunit CasA
VLLKDSSKNEVSELAFASGVNDDGSQFIDSMLAYLMVEVKNKDTNQKEMKKVSVHLHERGVWRYFDSLLPDTSHLAPKVIDHMVSLARDFPDRMAGSILAIGQKYNPPRPNIVFWRNEAFVLPQNISDEQYFKQDIRGYLIKAEDVSRSLYSACETFAESLLTRGSNTNKEERKPEKKDVSNFIEQMNVLPFYWSQLEAKFHEVLGDYARNRNPDDIHCGWLVAVRNALSGAWAIQQNSVSGGDVWTLRALIKANNVIVAKIKEMNEEIQQLKPEEVTA